MTALLVLFHIVGVTPFHNLCVPGAEAPAGASFAQFHIVEAPAEASFAQFHIVEAPAKAHFAQFHTVGAPAKAHFAEFHLIRDFAAGVMDQLMELRDRLSLSKGWGHFEILILALQWAI